jgi:hypothetical protein
VGGVTFVGDLNGDGRDELGIVELIQPFAPPAATILDAASHAILHQFGAAAGLGPRTGDLDGDGRDDFVRTYPFPRYYDPGAIDVHSGATGAFRYRLTGVSSSFGSGLTAAGDVDGDGVGDLACYDHTFRELPAFGRFYVFSGATGRELRAWPRRWRCRRPARTCCAAAPSSPGPPPTRSRGWGRRGCASWTGRGGRPAYR